MSEMREKCGVVGVFDPQAAELAATGIKVLDHRGPDSTGLGGLTDSGRFEVFSTPGKASEVLTDERVARIGAAGMTAVVAHTRYATSGGSSEPYPKSFGKAQKRILYVVNGNDSDMQKLEADVEARGHSTANKVDAELHTIAIGDRKRRGARTEDAIADAYPNFVGAFSSVVAGQDENGGPMLAAFRDRCGIRPLFWGQTPNGGYMFASETQALDVAGATTGGEVAPGSMMTVSHSGVRQYQLAPPNPKFDPCEIFYFSNKNSRFKGIPIGDIREALGRRLAEEYGLPQDGDLVVGVPNSAKPFAKGFADATGIPYKQEVLAKRNKERTFLGQNKAQQVNLRNKGYALDKRLVRNNRFKIIDDSIYRGNTGPYVTRTLMRAGAWEVDMYIGSPPIRYPNFYGLNTPTQTELVAAQKSVEDIREETGCRFLGYLSLDGMLEVLYDMTGEPADHFDLSAFTGDFSHTSIGNRVIEVPRFTGYSARKSAVIL
jgi:amidophosphoribosyltransferase